MDAALIFLQSSSENIRLLADVDQWSFMTKMRIIIREDQKTILRLVGHWAMSLICKLSWVLPGFPIFLLLPGSYSVLPNTLKYISIWNLITQSFQKRHAEPVSKHLLKGRRLTHLITFKFCLPFLLGSKTVKCGDMTFFFSLQTRIHQIKQDLLFYKKFSMASPSQTRCSTSPS